MSNYYYPAGVTRLPGEEKHRCQHCGDGVIDPLAWPYSQRCSECNMTEDEWSEECTCEDCTKHFEPTEIEEEDDA